MSTAVRDPLPPPVLEGVVGAAAKAFARAIGKQTMVDTMKRHATALGRALDRDGQRALLATITALARTLAALGSLEEIKRKPLRLTAYERQQQLEMLACAARIADKAHDAALARLAGEICEGAIRGTLVEVLRGGQIGLPPGAAAQVAAFLDDRTLAHPIVIRCALEAQYAARPKAARARWTAILKAAPKAKSPRDGALVSRVLDEIERREVEHTAWAPLVFPLTTHQARAIYYAAGSFVTKQRATFVAYLAWALASGGSREVIAVVSHQLYWAKLTGKVTADDLEAPLTALMARAAQRRDRTSIDALTRALTKIGVTLGAAGAAAPVRGKPIASVGTEGGPPLLVPAAHLAAWLGTSGPKPFDSGGSDYERACKARGPKVIAIGKGHGVVLDGQACDVYAEPTGLLLVADGDLAEEVAKAWRKVGTLVVGKGGVVIVDSAEAGKGRGVNRKKLALAAGTYQVLGHAPQGFGGDLSAARLVRVAVRSSSRG